MDFQLFYNTAIAQRMSERAVCINCSARLTRHQFTMKNMVVAYKFNAVQLIQSIISNTSAGISSEAAVGSLVVM